MRTCAACRNYILDPGAVLRKGEWYCGNCAKKNKQRWPDPILTSEMTGLTILGQVHPDLRPARESKS